eukprot:TRINITY_DN16689_c0_g1_i1.p1 TRINITY_DN16689_c0_g1~~TRINITY_DN16689_c0_g1_i1.p1  ORF type:complete len:192 (-),score=22.67 TRINITY_DN16689_c0_g1_i1:90-665(-)
MVPTSILLGIGQSVIWAGKGTYLTACSVNYAEEQSRTEQSVITSFTGIFYLFFQASSTMGNLLAFFILNKFKNGVWVMFIVFTASSLLGTFILLFLPHQPLDFLHKKHKTLKEKFEITFKLLIYKKMVFLGLPINYMGLEAGFIVSSYNSNVVKVVMGVKYIGLVMIIYMVLMLLLVWFMEGCLRNMEKFQ